MIVMAMAEHEGIDHAGIDAQEFDVVIQRLRSEAEVDKDVARLAATPRLDVHGKTEFAHQGLAGWMVTDAPAEVLDIDAIGFPAGCDGELIAVRHYANRDAIEFRN